MASSTREPTAVLTQPMTAPKITVSSSAFSRTPTSSQISVSHPQLAQLANAGLSAATHSITGKQRMSPKFQAPPLTGAAAMADNDRHKKEMEMEKRKAGHMMSANPARTALMGLQTQPISRLGDAPRPTIVTSTDAGVVAEPVEVDELQSSTPTVQSPLEMNASEQSASNAPTANNRKRPASPRLDERSVKAMTYPPPLGVEDDSPRSHRNFSYPGTAAQAASKSPSSASKKHKCPHCSTEFTRHHNLKSHLLTHSQEKPYGCQQCTSRFRRLHDLKRHLKLHTGERAHACVKCGRRFARGDALARHNKGPGGCAGRRGSEGDGGEDYNDDTEIDPSMEVSYHNGAGHENGDGDESLADDHRRRSEPDRSRNDTIGPAAGAVSGTYRQHSSTFPGIAPLSRGYYASTAPVHGANSSPREAPKLSPKQNLPLPHYSGSSMFAQSGITESPKPLSPRQQETQRLGTGSSVVSQSQQSRGARASGSAATQPMSTSSSSATLPSLNVLAAESRFPHPPTAGSGQPGSIYPSHHVSTPLSALSGVSGSSHGQSSGSSMRDLLHGGSQMQQLPPPQQDGMWEYMKSMERRLEEQLAMKLKEQESHYEAEISRLKEQITTLTTPQQRPALPLPGVSVGQ